MIGSRRLMGDVEQAAKVEPEGRCELRATITDGTPKCEIQVWIRAKTQSVAAVEERGIASGQWEVQSFTVRKWVKIEEGKRGPTGSM